MEIEFANNKLKKSLESEKALRRHYGQMSEKIAQRLQEFISAESLKDISCLPGPRLHPLQGRYQGCYAVDVKHPFRIIFKPVVGEKDNYGSITKIEIVTIKDYH